MSVWHSEPGSQQRLPAWPLACSSGHIGAGKRVVERGLAAAIRVAASLPVRAAHPGPHCSPFLQLPLSPAQPALAERKGIGLVSLLPRPQGAFLLEYIWTVRVTQTHLVKKCFSWTLYTEAAWKWVTMSRNLSLYFAASQSELRACWAWLASWHYLRLVCWEAVRKWVPQAYRCHISTFTLLVCAVLSIHYSVMLDV